MYMPTTSFPTVWARISAHAGQRFSTKTGRPFTYVIERDALVTDRTDYPLAKANFARSEERRVGKECRSRWSREHEKRKSKKTKKRDSAYRQEHIKRNTRADTQRGG